jgi:hypothetical protein
LPAIEARQQIKVFLLLFRKTKEDSSVLEKRFLTPEAQSAQPPVAARQSQRNGGSAQGTKVFPKKANNLLFLKKKKQKDF